MKSLHQFRRIAIAEACSFLVLLGIAMPLKYFAKIPVAVMIAGSIHGVLFIAYLVWAFEVKTKLAKSNGWLLKAILASVIPFGPFVFDRELRREDPQA